MGQRFQIIENTNGDFKVYHSQWLWGDYAIRRIGTAVKNFLKYNKDGYRSFEDYLKGSFYGKPEDMNSIGRYFDGDEWTDNKEILSIWKGKKKVLCKTREFKKFLQTLDNNDGFFYIEFNENWINGQKGIKGYCFILGGWRNEESKTDFKPITAKDYLKAYDRQEGFNKKQLKEFEDGRKVFEKLKLIEIPKKIIVDKKD